MSSLAERIFGLNIEPITPTKPSQGVDLQNVEVVTAVGGQDPMIEVVPGLEPKQTVDVMEMPPLPKATNSKSTNLKLKSFGFVSLFAAVGNIFGIFGGLNSLCEGGKCNSEATRLNWIDLHNVTNEAGWSLPYPELGIPDYVALVCSLLVLVIAFTKK